MSTLDRRRFLGAAAGAAAVLGTQSLRGAEPGAEPAAGEAGAAAAPPAPPIIELGNTGIKMSRLGQGTGVNGSNRQSAQTRAGFAELVALMNHAYDRGITFFDLADWYGTHIYFREALRTIPREKVTVLTKVWFPFDGPRSETNLPERRQVVQSTIERFCHEVTSDYIDIVLLHCLTDPGWERKMEPYMEVLSEAKQKGTVRSVGCSCHDLGALKVAAVSPWVDVILARTNPTGASMDGTPDEVVPVLRTAKEQGKAIIGMKIFGAGKLADRRDECMKYAQESGLMDAMTIGFHTPEQIDDVLRLMHKYPAKSA